MNIQTLGQRYIAVREKRLALEKQAAELKSGEEATLLADLMGEMQFSGIKSANIEGVGKLVLKETKYYAIQDTEQFARAMFQSMLDAAKAGRPFSDGLLLQKRIHRENLEAIMENSGMDAGAFGVSQLSRTDLSLTKAK